jgi:Peptidase family M28
MTFLLVALLGMMAGAFVAQQSQGPAAPPRNPTPADMPLATLQDMFVRFPLPPGQEAYANIDGRHLHQFVVEQANISRQYRDAGHPKFWGRIIGTSADHVQRVPNLKTAQIWGTLPGATDETIYLFAHRDGWFDASGDNASGVASMLGLAEHAKIPQAQRKRTMIFVALDGHHNSGEGSAVGNKWLVDNRQKLFAKTALAINVEHPSTVQTQSRPRYYNANEIVWGNTYMPQQWYAGGPSRPELQKIAASAFKQFGATMDLYPSPVPPASDLSSFFRFLPGIDTSEFHHYFHTDLETPQTVPWTGLEASTRAYAKIIDEVNRLPLTTFQRPEERTSQR